MNIAIFVSILTAVLIAICLPLFFSSKQHKEAEEKARARRVAEAKMNARLLKMNL